MDQMSHDSSAGDIANQLVNISSGAMESGASAVASLTGLIPAGSEEVSMQAAAAFALEGAQMLASNTAAQQELMSAGMSLMDIATNYGNVDGAGADSLGGPMAAARSLTTGWGAGGGGARLAGAHPGVAARCGRSGGPTVGRQLRPGVRFRSGRAGWRWCRHRRQCRQRRLVGDGRRGRPTECDAGRTIRVLPARDSRLVRRRQRGRRRREQGPPAAGRAAGVTH